ncbi:endonuclease/exonuclease/phosphatase family protein [Ureaplasma canigenitalium]|uniref:endonuclease/exonuclease/phosphatase family protein n=1 Tax=Ureaplasma canigenitalium TaxID=42092 RepID=UPI000690149D|nr:endonuclease/exonuclease/phosphatase family protein [Ureaplasma canigenitalium]
MKIKRKIQVALGSVLISGTLTIIAVSCVKHNGNNKQEENNRIKENGNTADHSNQSGTEKNETPVKSTIRLGHWNILNQGGDDYLKNEAIAKIILYSGVDVIGLTELNATPKTFNNEKRYQAIESIVNVIRKYDKKNLWTYTISKDLFGSNYETQKERVGFIYKKNVVEVKENFITYEVQGSGRDQLFKQEFNPTNDRSFISYSRPPSGVTFITPDKRKDFTFVLSHLDSPGEKKGSETRAHDYLVKSKYMGIKTAQGSKELNEAFQLNNVMSFFDDLDGKNDDLIFMGDTNIKKGNESIAFRPLLLDGYISLLKDSDDKNRTSLSRSFNQYSQPYDKMFLKTDGKYLNPKKIDIWSLLFNEDVISKDWRLETLKFYYTGKGKKIHSLNELTNINQQWHQKTKNLYEYYTKVMGKISDHTMTYFDLELKENDIELEHSR